jgi:hypothetical protein
MKYIVFRDSEGKMTQYVEADDPESWLESVKDKLPSDWTYEITDLVVVEE